MVGLLQIPSSPCSTAKLQELSCWCVGHQERSAPSVLQLRRTGYWTTTPPLGVYHPRPKARRVTPI